MKKLLLVWCAMVYARNPFMYEEGYHCRVCTALGQINDQYSVAQVMIDGVSYTVRPGDVIGTSTVTAVIKEGIMLTESTGEIILLPLKKGPFNLGKLKG